MSRLQLQGRLSLDGISEGWTNEHFLDFKIANGEVSAAYLKDLEALGESKDSKGYLDVYAKYAKLQFVSGNVLVDGATVPAEKEDIDDFPPSVLSDIFEIITRSKFDDPKAGTNSTLDTPQN